MVHKYTRSIKMAKAWQGDGGVLPCSKVRNGGALLSTETMG